ncbi:MAG: ABC transporter substrate-binding protein [candidate division Zixibacteria bacterium]|nr:ABC transporter substrate-binding protein [candidate division Zixibacteria bacterium]
MRKGLVIAMVLVFVLAVSSYATVKIGLNYPKTGPYSVQGLDQWRATELAVAEINGSGGINGEQVEIVWRDTQSKPAVATQNANELIDNEGVKMVFGGSSSGVAIATAKVCHEKNIPFFGTLTYSTATTGKEGLRTTFRECYNSWMAATAMGTYLKEGFPGKKYFYITADYTWGWTTESSVREFTSTKDASEHKGVKTPFPGATPDDFKKALSFAKMVKPDVLVLVLFGKDMSQAVRQATAMGLKKDMQVVVPNLTLGMAEGGGPKVMEGVVGSLPWCWQVPYKYGYSSGKEFVEKFASKFDRYPSTSGASAYSILYEYKNAVERAQTFNTDAIISALEGHEYTLLKDKQYWRDFDHQSIQTTYLVKCKPESDVLKDKFQLDYFEILSSIPGEKAARSHNDWISVREAAGKATKLY